MNYKSFNLGDWIGHISGVIEDESELDGNEMRDLVEFLSRLPRWIPVSERLPDGQTEVIVSILDNSGDTAFNYTSSGWVTIDREYWIVDNEICNYVKAWMPLPEPYEPQESEVRNETDN